MSDQEKGMENMEALWRGQKGDKGDKGQRGLPQGQARAIVYLFVLCIALFLVLGVGLFHQQSVFQQRISQADAHNARIRCQAIAQIVAIPVPSPVAGNPSRMWEASYEHVQRQRGIAAGCKLPALSTVAKGHPR